jgi:drug/metabolite transporter (DMT)-like permease
MLGSSTLKTRGAVGDYLLLTLQQLIGSSTHLVAKRVVSQLSPELSLFWRSLIAALSSMAWLLYENHRTALLHQLRLRQVVLLLVLGLLAVPLNQWCFLAGVRLSTPANASLMYALTPVWTLLLSSALHQERLTALKLTGVLLAVGGVVLVLWEEAPLPSSSTTLGNWLLLLASWAWALYTVLSQRVAMQLGALKTTALSMVLGWMLYLPLWAALGAELGLELLSPSLVLELLYMGVVTSGIGYLLWVAVLQRLEASKVAVFATLQPVLTTLAAIPLFGFVPSFPFLLGGMAILAGMLLTQLG